jgi:hypothetical protein
LAMESYQLWARTHTEHLERLTTRQQQLKRAA